MESVSVAGILFADIAGSTQLYERLGDPVAMAIIHEALQVMTAGVTLNAGTVVKTIGDEVMAAFPDAAAAFDAARDIRARIGTLPPLPPPEVRPQVQVRIGVHVGPALREEGDYFGDTVNIAARLVALANPDQILISGDLLDCLPVERRAMATEFAMIEVKGRRDPLRIAQVTDGLTAQETTQIGFGRASQVPEAPAAHLTLTVQGQTWPVPPGTRRLVIGRDASCDLVLSGGQVSRQHATIEFRRGKVILIDHSSNGTTLVVRDERPVRLLREEFGMIHGGHVIFGRLNDPGAVVIGFTVA
jgi:adenylate cyclase